MLKLKQLNQISKISIIGILVIYIGCFFSINHLITYTETNLENTATKIDASIPLFEASTKIKYKAKSIRLIVMEYLANRSLNNPKELFTTVDKINFEIDDQIDIVERYYSTEQTLILKKNLQEWRLKRHYLFNELAKGDFNKALEVAKRDNFAEEEFETLIKNLNNLENYSINNLDGYRNSYKNFYNEFKSNANYWLLFITLWTSFIFIVLITIVIKKENILNSAASIDHLTGVYNRRELNKQFELKKLYSTPNSTLGILNIDIDHFKKINDSYGHPTGDEVLKTFTRIIQSIVRKNDIIARNGGEEFVILFENLTNKQLYNIAEKIRQKTEEYKFEVPEGKFSITISIGALTRKLSDISLENILSESDSLLYISKQSGRNCITQEEELSAQ